MRLAANTPDASPEAQALALALAFWKAVAQEKRISSGLWQWAQWNAVGLGTLWKISENQQKSLP